MIPVVEIDAEIPFPLPECAMPSVEEISEEGFGYFRGTWLVGRVTTENAQSTLHEEAQFIQILDAATASPDDFEELASAIEANDLDGLSKSLRTAATKVGLEELLDDDLAPLDGLEIGVAGLTHALSSVGCMTAASCRSHMEGHSWSDCPVVFFAAPPRCVELLAQLMPAASCGLGADRGMLKITAPSIVHMHALARDIVIGRSRFPREPDHRRTTKNLSPHSQLKLPLERE